jgi:hypothetical protein
LALASIGRPSVTDRDDERVADLAVEGIGHRHDGRDHRAVEQKKTKSTKTVVNIPA